VVFACQDRDAEGGVGIETVQCPLWALVEVTTINERTRKVCERTEVIRHVTAWEELEGNALVGELVGESPNQAFVLACLPPGAEVDEATWRSVALEKSAAGASPQIAYGEWSATRCHQQSGRPTAGVLWLAWRCVPWSPPGAGGPSMEDVHQVGGRADSPATIGEGPRPLEAR